MDNDEIIEKVNNRQPNRATSVLPSPRYKNAENYKATIECMNEARASERAKIVERLKEEKKKLHPMCDDALDDIIQELESYNTPSK